MTSEAQHSPGRTPIKVSVLLLTYNHEQFIGEAIEGFLRQKTDFPCELVIADDCSRDGTRDVIRRYWEKHPDRIRVLLNRRNIKARRTVARAYQQCRGQYVATLEGDDYWTCPDKLRRQADFLDRHLDCAMCFHSVTVVWDDGSEDPVVFRPPVIQEIYTLSELLESNFIGACSPMYRKGVFGAYPDWFYIPVVGDWPHHVLHAQYGRIGYIDEPMGVYRQHASGIYSGLDMSQKTKVAIETLRRLRCVLPPEHRLAASRSLCGYCCRLAHQYCDEGKRADARRCLSQFLQEVGLPPGLPARCLLNAALRAYVPGLHGWLKRVLKRSGPPGKGDQNDYAIKEIE